MAPRSGSSGRGRRRSAQRHWTMDERQETQEQATPKHRVLRRVAPLVVLNLLGMVSYGIMSTIVPILMTQYYAHGTKLNCEVEARQAACVEGSKHAAWMSSVFGAIGSGTLVFSAPLLGHASDVFGRKVFLLATQILSLLTTLSALYFTLSGKGITLYFVLVIFTTAAGMDGILSAATADCVGPLDRATAYGFIFAATISGYITATFVTGLSSRMTSLYVALGFTVAQVMWAIFAVNETLSRESRSRDGLRAVGNPLASLAILFRSKFFIFLTCLTTLSSFAFTGILTIQVYYFNVVMGFTLKDIALFLLIAGAVAILAQGLLLQPLVARIRERGVVIASLANNVVSALVFIIISGFYPRKWMVFATIPVGILSYLSFPALSTLTSINIAEKDQGRILGAMYGARSVADATGSLAYGRVYGTMDTTSPVSRMGPYILTAAVYLVGTVFAVLLPKTNDPLPEKIDQWVVSARSRTESGSAIDMAFLPMPSSARCVELQHLDEVQGAV